jgi:predicted protein tyrosine phosphatase
LNERLAQDGTDKKEAISDLERQLAEVNRMNENRVKTLQNENSQLVDENRRLYSGIEEMQLSMLTKQTEFQNELQNMQSYTRDMESQLNRLQLMYDESIQSLSTANQKESELMQQLKMNASKLSVLELDHARLSEECEKYRSRLEEKENEIQQAIELNVQQKFQFETLKKEYDEKMVQDLPKVFLDDAVKMAKATGDSIPENRNSTAREPELNAPLSIMDGHLIAKLQTEVLELKWNNNLLHNLLKDERHQLNKMKLEQNMHSNQALFVSSRNNQESSSSSSVLERIKQLETDVMGLKGIEEDLAQKILKGDVNQADLLVFLKKHSKFHSKIDDETKRIRHHYRKEIKRLNLRFDSLTRDRKLLDRLRANQEREKFEHYQKKIRELNVLVRK